MFSWVYMQTEKKRSILHLHIQSLPEQKSFCAAELCFLFISSAIYVCSSRLQRIEKPYHQLLHSLGCLPEGISCSFLIEIALFILWNDKWYKNYSFFLEFYLFYILASIYLHKGPCERQTLHKYSQYYKACRCRQEKCLGTGLRRHSKEQRKCQYFLTFYYSKLLSKPATCEECSDNTNIVLV